jgi:hypothetical protein
MPGSPFGLLSESSDVFWNIFGVPVTLISMSMPIVLWAFIPVTVSILLGGTNDDTTSERDIDLIVVHKALESGTLSSDPDGFVRIIDRKVDVRVIRSRRDSHHSWCVSSGYSDA